MTRWTWVALIANVHYWRPFVHCCTPRQWGWTDLMIGGLHMLFGATHVVVAIRSLIDPEFPGYQLGSLRFEKQSAALPTAAILIWALTTACLVVRRDNGKWLRRFAQADFWFAAVMNGIFLAGWIRGELSGLSLRFGQASPLTGASAAAIPVLVDTMLFSLSALWLLHRSNQDQVPHDPNLIVSR